MSYGLTDVDDVEVGTVGEVEVGAGGGRLDIDDPVAGSVFEESRSA
jgi:hypothetical protein